MKKILILTGLLICNFIYSQDYHFNSVVIGGGNTPPASGEAGQIWWDSDDLKFVKHDGTSWSDLSSSGEVYFDNVFDTGYENPNNYTKANDKLAGHMQGVDAALASLQNINRIEDIFLSDDSESNLINYMNNETYVVQGSDNYFFFVYSFLGGGTTVATRKIYILKNLGTGTYGFGGIAISASDLSQIDYTIAYPDEIENLGSTQNINLGDVGSNDIVTAFNSHTFSGQESPIQNQADGYVLIDVTIDSEPLQYLFIGTGGDYGVGGSLTAVESDFIAVSNELPPPPELNENLVIVKTKDQIVNTTLSSTKIYYVAAVLEELIAGEYIDYTGSDLSLLGYSFNVSKISKNVSGESIFRNTTGGGDLILGMIEISSGLGSVFDISDSDGTHAIEINDVNFIGCESLGLINDYRQFTGTTLGIYSSNDGFTLSGSWNGFKLTNTNIFGFGSSGVLIKEGTGLTFDNRLFLNLNIDFPTGAILTDLSSSNFNENELLQINSSIAKLNNVIDLDNSDDLIPNISVNDPKSLWVGNIGLPDTAVELYVEDSNVSSSYNIDWRKDTYNLTLTGDVTFTESNLPADGKNTQEIKLYLTGEFIPTFPSGWEVNQIGTYKGSDINEVTIKFVKNGLYFTKISNTLSVYPSPDVSSVDPVSIQPSTTAELNIYGSFFTPASTIDVENQTINSVEFVNSGHLKLSITTSAIEESVDITISNGTEKTFSNKFEVNLGVVFIPTSADWINVNSQIDVSENGKAKIVTYDALGQATWDQIVDFSKDWIIEFRYDQSALAPTDNGADTNTRFELIDALDSSVKFYLWAASGAANPFVKSDSPNVQQQILGPPYNIASPLKFQMKFINGVFTIWKEDSAGSNTTVVKYTYASLPFSADMRIKVKAIVCDYIDIKYIELPD